MKFVIFRPKKEENSYPTLQDEKTAVAKFLNCKAQEGMRCLDTQEPSNEPSPSPNEVPTDNVSNLHDQTVDQVPHTYQASKHEYSTPSVKFLHILPVIMPNLFRLNMSYW